MVYDGDCGFCKYWLVKWKKVSEPYIDFEPYQKASRQFKDITEDEFKKAVQLILTSGKVYSGAAAAYYTYKINGSFPLLFRIYEKNSFFRWLSDSVYSIIAKNRNAAYKLTRIVFGADPEKSSKYRIGFFLLILILIFLSIANTLLR